MSKIETGGPAFPGEEDVNYPSMTATEKHTGMTLRDYFAAKALQGMLSDLPKTLYGLDWQANTVASAYSIADAMLEARK